MSSELNAPQAQAAAHRDGPLLVFAGAGSGKTRVITQRVANLVAGGADPSRVCAVTFTNKAAGEMRERLASMLGEQTAKKLTISTFHALCVRLLRSQEGLALSGRKPGFVIYDERDSEQLLQAFVLESSWLDGEDAEPSEQQFASEKKKLVAEQLEFIEERKQALDDPDSYTASNQDRPRVDAWRRYEEAKRSSNAFDFSDLLYFGTKLIEHRDLGERSRQMFDYLMIDEFQDTDGLQLRFVKGLASKGNICVVGDDDQCIYAWRGAEVENIRGFRTHFPAATVVKLEQNYRSTANVIHAAVNVIERAFNREPKRMFTSSQPGDPVKVVRCRDDYEEAKAIVGEAMFLASQGVPLGSIAVLYRSHATARLIEKELREAEIHYTTHGGFRWFDRAEIRDAISLFKLVTNPSSNVDCIRSLQAIPRGIGATTLSKVMDLSAKHSLSVFTTLRRRDLVKASAPTMKAIDGFVSTVLSLSTEAETVGCSTAVARLLEDSGIVAHYRDAAKKCLSAGGRQVQPAALDAKTKAKYEAAIQKAERLEELVADAQRFEDRAKRRGDRATFADYVEAICLRADDRAEDDAGVQLMTVHASKGLEFDTVFVPASEQEAFARGVSEREEVEDEKVTPETEEEVQAQKEDRDAEDDARRLFYVAITRAKRRLYLLWCDQRTVRGKMKPRTPCSFLSDIPEGVAVKVEVNYLVERGRAAMSQFEEQRKGAEYVRVA